MSPLGYVVLAVVLIAAWVMIRREPPSSRGVAEVLDWRLTRSPELEAQLEIDDVAQMLEATNERRRLRGERERALEEIEADVTAFQRMRIENADKAELEAMLRHANERRRARGAQELRFEDLQ
jgi:hypothetical protein